MEAKLCLSQSGLQLLPAPARPPTRGAAGRLRLSPGKRQVLPRAGIFKAQNFIKPFRPLRDPVFPAGQRIGSEARPRPGRGHTGWAGKRGTEEAPPVRRPPTLPGIRLARPPRSRALRVSRLLPAAHLLCVRVVAVPVAALMPFHLHSP